MILAPLAFAMFSASQPQPAVATRPVLHQAIVDAARRSAPLLQSGQRAQRGGPYPLSPRAGRKTAGVLIGVAGGFFGGMMIGFAQSHGECGPTPQLLIATTVGGGVAGWLLAGD
jgi:hypothetical protein